MRKTIAAATGLAIAGLSLGVTACGSSGPSVSACKTAMTQDYKYALAHPDAAPAAKPAACKGLSAAELNKITASIMAGSGSVPAAAVSTPATVTATPVAVVTRTVTPAPTPTVTRTVQAAAPAAPAPVQAAPVLTSASAVVTQYYQDITDRAYYAAWLLGGVNIGGSSYAGWTAGYDTTASITLYDASDWNSGEVTAYLSAVQDDGTVNTYYGSYYVSGGVITSADIQQTS